MESKKNILILGSTGSIGRQTLDVVRKNPSKLNVVGLVAYSSRDKLTEDANEFNVENTILVSSYKTEEDASKAIIELIYKDNVEYVVNAMSGAAGLQMSYSVLEAGKILCLANKESLVVGGDLIMPLAAEQSKSHHGQIRMLPIDSEHGAIFQCLVGESVDEVTKLHITASGGPFFGKQTSELENITKDQALAHPTWNMGPKITIDSSTLMNKGLEVIEAHHLFDMDYDKINVLVHRQSIIHSMVEFTDGSVKAHLGTTDMRIPIQYTLSYPDRWGAPVEAVDFTTLKSLTFEKPDMDTFTCLKMAFEAGHIGGTMPCVMNAANEIAVAEFLSGNCGFLDIANTVEKTMEAHRAGKEFECQKVESLKQIKTIDKWARKYAYRLLK